MLARSQLLSTCAFGALFTVHFTGLLPGPFQAQAQAYAQTQFQAMRYLDYDTLGTVQTAGDFDGDGDVDLLHYFNTLTASNFTVFTNDGEARFSFGDPQPVGAVSGGELEEAAGVGDFNGDGFLDLALARIATDVNPGHHTLVLVQGNGDGTFGAKFPYTPAGAVDLMAMEVRDRSGTGVPEIAFAKRLAGGEVQVGWLRWNGSTFVETVSAPMAPGLFGELEVGDWGGDGELDLIVLQPDGLALRPFQSINGVPFELPAIPLPPAIHGGAQLRAATGDLDDDGRDDLIVFDRTSFPNGAGWTEVAFFSGQPSGTLFAAGEQFLDDPSSGTGIDFDYFEAAPELVDWDGDGDLDMVHASSHPYSDDIVFLENNGGFQLSFAGSLPGVCVTGGVADLNGDGHPDLYTGCGVYLGSGAFDMGFHEANTGSLPAISLYTDSGDWDRDGDLDLFSVGAQTLHLNDGTGQFTTVPIFVPAAPAGFQFLPQVGTGDFNGDGREDQIVPRRKEIQPGIFVQDGYNLLAGDLSGNYTDMGSVTPPKMVIPSGTSGIGADLSGDGLDDLLVSGGYHLNIGGSLITGFQGVFVGDPIVAEDFDGDGDVDVITQVSGFPGSYRLQRNLGGFPFLEFADEFLAEIPDSFAVLSLADLDADQDLDVLINSTSGNETELLENVEGIFSPAVVLIDDENNSGLGTLPAVVADMDGDGLVDVATVRRESVSFYGEILTVYRQKAPWDFELDGRFWGLSLNQVGDFDGDGDQDAIGVRLMRNRQVEGSQAGSKQQYGEGVSGSGNFTPLLGVSGLAQQGKQPVMRLSRAVGGAPTFFAIGTAPAEFTNLPFPGLVQYIDGLIDLFYWPASGPLGQPGEGFWEIPYDVNLDWAGLTFTHQVFCVDLSSPSLLTATNGLAITYGE